METLEFSGCSNPARRVGRQAAGPEVAVASPPCSPDREEEETLMKKVCSFVLCLLLASPVVSSADDRILRFDTMVGVTGPFRGAANPIRGVNGGGAAWALEEAKGELRLDGRLEIEVKGLVVVNTGVNPQPNFRAIVSCLTIDAAGNAVTSNVTTGQFPATPTGDSEIETVVVLPSPCIAPIVFVTNANGTSWFAATGY